MSIGSRPFHAECVKFSSSLSGRIDKDGVVRSPFPDVPLLDCNLCDFVLNHTKKEGGQIAMVHGVTGEEVTFDRVRENTAKLSSGLVRMGLRRNDVLSIVSANSLEYGPLFLGVAAAGGVVSTINPTYTCQEIKFQLEISNSKFVATTPALLSVVEEAAQMAGVKNIVTLDSSDQNRSGLVSYGTLLQDSGSLFKIETVDARNDVVALPFSSGTTGLPKGVMLTHHNLVSNMCQLDHPEILRFPAETSVLALLPFFHIYGLVVVLLAGISNGHKLVVLPSFDPTTFLSAVTHYRVQHAYLVPPIVLFLAKHPDVSNYDLTCLKSVTSGAAPLGGELVREAQQRIGIERILQAYGLTETSPVTHCMPKTLGLSKPASIGALVQNQLAKIVCIETGKVLGADEVGELVLSGPNVMKGYHNNPEATDKCVDKERWFYTGDVGYYDKDGHFYITDRLKELIKVKGLQVAPAELEALLHQHSKVSDAAVVGVPDERFGEAPKAFVVRKDSSLTEDEVVRFVQSNVARHKWLEGGVEFVDQIPKSASGKILRRLLKGCA